MRNKRILTSAVLATALAVVGGSSAFAQTPVIQNRVAQPVAINGTRVDAAYVLAPGGGIQSYSCPAPQQYATLDGATQGWACFDAATNVWLLSALPPQQQAPAPAPIVVQQAAQAPVIYQQPVVYTVAQPTIIYSDPGPYFYGSVYPRGYYYSPSIAFGVAGINAGGRIAASIIESSRFDHRDGRFDDRRDGRSNVRIVESRGSQGHRR